MNIPTITMDAHQAEQQFQEYAAALQSQHNAEYEAIAAGLNALRRGQRLLNLHDAMRSGGLDEVGRPKLAICPARERFVRFGWHDRRPTFFWEPQFDRSHTRKHLALPTGLWTEPRQSYGIRARAVVPIVPPRFVPRTGINRLWILWEAEWEAVPVDPMLLRRIHGPLFAILAVWDLTELERAVLGQRLVVQ